MADSGSAGGIAMKFAICGLSHETHTFSSICTDREEFQKRTIAAGKEIIEEFSGSKTAVGGFIDYCAGNDVEVVPVLYAAAWPSGLVAEDTYQEFLDTTIEGIRGLKGLDAVLARLHGAMVTEEHDDAEGFFLRKLRQCVGEGTFIACTLDLHANITKEMVAHAGLLVGCRTYPHIDFYERGLEAAKVAYESVLTGTVPCAGFRKLPLCPHVLAQGTSISPMKEIMAKAAELRSRDDVRGITVSAGFPWADIEEIGFSTIAYTRDDPRAAQDIADEIADFAWSNRERFALDSMSVTEAVETAMQVRRGPVVLADIADNPGGGTPCDGTVLLQALLDRHAENTAVGVIADPECVNEAVRVGVGGTATLRVGGKTDDLHGPTLDLTGVVRSITDGVFTYRGPMWHGSTGNLGRTVVFRCDGIDIVITENRVQVWDREIFRRNGIEPEEKSILVVKSTVHFEADFAPIASRIIKVATPGLLSPDLSLFDYKKARPFYPLDRNVTST